MTPLIDTYALPEGSIDAMMKYSPLPVEMGAVGK